MRITFLAAFLLLAVNWSFSQLSRSELSIRTGIEESIIQLIEEKSGAKAAELDLSKWTNEPVAVSGISVDLESHRSWEVVNELSERVSSAGYHLFVCNESFGFNGAPNTVALVKLSSQFEILRIMGTSNVQKNLTTDKVIETLRLWHSQYKIKITGSGTDWVRMNILDLPANSRNFAKEVYKFCPGIIDYGIGTIDNLALEISKSNCIHLWWN